MAKVVEEPARAKKSFCVRVVSVNVSFKAKNDCIGKFVIDHGDEAAENEVLLPDQPTDCGEIRF